jgi:hypothetical protein
MMRAQTLFQVATSGIGLWVAGALGAITYAQQAVLVRENFNSSPPLYGFQQKYPENGNWRSEHLPNGGWDGSGAARVVQLAGRPQYTLGWTTRPFNHSFAMGDGVYIRFRIRFDDTYRWSGTHLKFMLMGQSAGSPNSRINLYLNSPNDSQGCSLGMVDYTGTNRTFPWATPGHFGLPHNDWSDSAIRGRYGSIAPYVNISWSCGHPALMSHGNNASAPPPGPNSSRPENGWYHFQVYARSGAPGQAEFRTWVNNNNFNAPTAQRANLQEGLGVLGWSGGITVGASAEDGPPIDLGYVIDDLEVGLTFDPNWSRSGGSTPSPPAPQQSPPSTPPNFRFEPR